MFNQHTLVRSTLAAALLSALVLAQPAHAGLLGGGSLGGGLGGSLGGSFGPRSVDIGGQAAGQVSREGSLLPRGDKAVQKAGDTPRQAGAVQRSATVTAGEQAMLTGERAGAVSGSAAGTGTAAGRAPALPAATGGAGEAGATSRMLDASARGSAQASRTGRSASVDASAEAAVRR